LEEIEDAQAVALGGITTMMAERVNGGSHGALSTEDDPDTNGYYVIEWTSNSHTLQEDAELKECDPAVGPCCSKMVAQTYDDHTF
jgi:hypothetical protein